MRDYTKIDAWRLAGDLTVAAHERTRTRTVAFPATNRNWPRENAKRAKREVLLAIYAIFRGQNPTLEIVATHA